MGPAAQASGAIMSGLMTQGERIELSKLVRIRARVAKADVDALAARHLADVEAELAARYSANHHAWAEVTQQAKAAIATADAEIAERCRALGIRDEFRPQLFVSWSGRGENGDKTRRAELRKVAETELAARAKAAKVEIQRYEATQLTHLAAGALASDEARAFLEAMPTPAQLMPPVALLALEATLAARGGE
jgi:hypothetical protein